jgi:hypothetical protein
MSRIDQLKRLSDLKNAGALSDDEFAREKTLILDAPESSGNWRKTLTSAVVCTVCVFIVGAVYFGRHVAPIAPVVSAPALPVATASPAQPSKPQPVSSGATDALPTTTTLTEVGQCTNTSIASVGTRLEDTPGSGTAITYADGTSGVSYDTVQDAEASQVGDPVKLCLIEVPKGCPPGDDQGKVYSAEDSRTGRRWSLPNSSHTCGGA